VSHEWKFESGWDWLDVRFRKAPQGWDHGLMGCGTMRLAVFFGETEICTAPHNHEGDHQFKFKMVHRVPNMPIKPLESSYEPFDWKGKDPYL